MAAISYMEKTGYELIEQHDLHLGKLMLQEAQKRDYLEVIAPGNTLDRAALISLRLKNYSNMGDVARMMSDSYGIMCRSGHMCSQPFIDSIADGEVLRASCYIYNDEQDVTEFFEAFDEIQRVI